MDFSIWDKITLYRVSLRRVRDVRFSEAVTRPLTAVETIKKLLGDTDRECLIVLFLDTHNHILGAEVSTVGSLNTTRTHPREIFKGAILAGALGIILGHNHPSGNAEPSDEDIAFTRSVAKAGEIVGIEVYDHLIVTDIEHTSLRERGLF